MIENILFAIGFLALACTVCWVGVVYQSTRRTIRCRCGRTVRRVSLITFPDVVKLSRLLTNECPICKGDNGIKCGNGIKPEIHPSSKPWTVPEYNLVAGTGKYLRDECLASEHPSSFILPPSSLRSPHADL